MRHSECASAWVRLVHVIWVRGRKTERLSRLAGFFGCFFGNFGILEDERGRWGRRGKMSEDERWTFSLLTQQRLRRAVIGRVLPWWRRLFFFFFFSSLFPLPPSSSKLCCFYCHDEGATMVLSSPTLAIYFAWSWSRHAVEVQQAILQQPFWGGRQIMDTPIFLCDIKTPQNGRKRSP